MEILVTKDLCKVYDKFTAVDGISMTINKGDIYGLIGKNGAGKTTFMRMILTLCKPTSGKIELFGTSNLKEACVKVGSLIETPALPKGITALELIRRYSILYGADISKAEELLRLVGLENTGKKKIGKFSLGMKQRLGIAVALLNDPEFLILDEPMNGLDPAGMKEIRDLIVKLNKDKGITFLISSHLLEELSKTVTKIGIVNKGTLIEEKTIEEIIKSCVKKILFEVNDISKSIDILSKIVDEKMLSEEDGKLCITGAEDRTAEFNKELVTSGILVSGIEKSGYNLEDYFLDKIGDNHDEDNLSKKAGDAR